MKFEIGEYVRVNRYVSVYYYYADKTLNFDLYLVVSPEQLLVIDDVRHYPLVSSLGALLETVYFIKFPQLNYGTWVPDSDLIKLSNIERLSLI